MSTDLRIQTLLILGAIQLQGNLLIASQYPAMVDEDAVVYFAKNGFDDRNKTATKAAILGGDTTKLQKMMEQMGQFATCLPSRTALGIDQINFNQLRGLSGFFRVRGLPATENLSTVEKYAMNCIEANKFLHDPDILKYINRKLPPAQWGGTSVQTPHQQNEGAGAPTINAQASPQEILAEQSTYRGLIDAQLLQLADLLITLTPKAKWPKLKNIFQTHKYKTTEDPDAIKNTAYLGVYKPTMDVDPSGIPEYAYILATDMA